MQVKHWRPGWKMETSDGTDITQRVLIGTTEVQYDLSCSTVHMLVMFLLLDVIETQRKYVEPPTQQRSLLSPNDYQLG